MRPSRSRVLTTAIAMCAMVGAAGSSGCSDSEPSGDLRQADATPAAMEIATRYPAGTTCELGPEVATYAVDESTGVRTVDVDSDGSLDGVAADDVVVFRGPGAGGEHSKWVEAAAVGDEVDFVSAVAQFSEPGNEVAWLFDHSDFGDYWREAESHRGDGASSYSGEGFEVRWDTTADGDLSRVEFEYDHAEVGNGIPASVVLTRVEPTVDPADVTEALDEATPIAGEPALPYIMTLPSINPACGAAAVPSDGQRCVEEIVGGSTVAEWVDKRANDDKLRIAECE